MRADKHKTMFGKRAAEVPYYSQEAKAARGEQPADWIWNCQAFCWEPPSVLTERPASPKYQYWHPSWKWDENLRCWLPPQSQVVWEY